MMQSQALPASGQGRPRQAHRLQHIQNQHDNHARSRHRQHLYRLGVFAPTQHAATGTRLLTAAVVATFHSAENLSKGRLWAGCLILKNAA